jgi:ELWxxDGT repeat protein
MRSLIPAVAALGGFLVLSSSLRAQCDPPFDIEPGTLGSIPDQLTATLGDLLLFSARTPATGAELFGYRRSTGTPFLVADINSGSSASNPEQFVECCTASGAVVFFYARSSNGAELWRTDGTALGTFEVADIRPGGSSGLVGEVTAVGNRVFFTANDGVHGPELWVSDGTSGGTQMVADIRPGSGGSGPDALTAFGDRVLFTAFDASTGRELYISDGTAAGTQLVAEIRPGTSSPNIFSMAVFDGRVYFGADDGTTGNELWATDGTTAGTVRIADIETGGFGSFPDLLTPADDALYFTAAAMTKGRELWKTDGTAAGTVLVADVNTGPSGSLPQHLTPVGGRLFFAADRFSDGRELWVSDGTTAGTVLAADIVPGPASALVSELVSTGSGVCFRADGGNGLELWFSDGTPAGTFEVCDIEPGPTGSNPTQITVSAGELFCRATVSGVGEELVRLPAPGATHRRIPGASLPDLPPLWIQGDANPVLGSTFTIRARGPAGHVGGLYLSPILDPLPPLPFFVDGGCDAVGLQVGQAIAVLGTAMTDFSFPVPVPVDPTLVGVGANLQFLWYDFTAGPPPVQTSNGLQIVFGNASP